MDVVRPRAIPPLIAALAALAAPPARAACEALDGAYRYQAAAAADGPPRHLSDLTMGPERRKLFGKAEAPARGPAWNSDQPRSRPTVNHLASTVVMAAVARGATLEFRDAQGKALATLGIGEGWSCKGDHLERGFERVAGLGEQVRSERVEESISRAANGDLVYAETVTVLDPPGPKPRRTEVRYPAAK